MKSNAAKLTSYIYLLLIPIIASGLGFGVGYVSYKIYLPIWLLNIVFMTLASWKLGLHITQGKNDEENKLAKSAFFLIIPWILISMFAGLGPPPETATEWTASATEQQVRYFMLVISGVSIAFGFVGLRDRIKAEGEHFYSSVGLTAILIAIPLFLINMLYWGFYLTELFKIQTTANSTSFPDWFSPIKQLFDLISVVEVALTYFATFVIVKAMRQVGWINKTSSFFYTLFSLLALTIVILSAFFRETLKVPGFALSIPAFPFLMPYIIGINLLRRVGNINKTVNND